MPRVNAIVDHIREIGGQPIVEASGSPDSYHIYMPILPTPLETAHNFIKTLHNELKQAHEDLDFKNDTETDNFGAILTMKENQSLHCDVPQEKWDGLPISSYN